jgi:4,5:9,10-diseco-3-hydroxy-5,9,17-trioxoandrosta-1(10),2-diene-4-oate hydrolase
VIDFPGWGRSSKNLRAGTFLSRFRNGARALLAFMDAIGVTKAHLVGNSFGGTAALYAALEKPDRFDRLMSPPPGGAGTLATEWPTAGLKMMLAYYKDDGPSLSKMRALLDQLVHDRKTISAAFVRERFAASIDPSVLENPPIDSPAIKAPKEALVSNQPGLAKLTHPTLLIWGRADRINPPNGAASFAAIPRHQLVWLDRVGHWPQWESAAQCNDLILRHLVRL